MLTTRDHDQIEADAHADARAELFREIRTYLDLCQKQMAGDHAYAHKMVDGFAEDVAAMLRSYADRVEKHRAERTEYMLGSIEADADLWGRVRAECVRSRDA